MRQRVADFGGDQRALPVRRKTGLGQSDGFGVVVEDREADFIAQFRAGLHQPAQAVHDAVQVQLRAENQIRFGAEPVPEHEPEFVLEEPREHPVRTVADELAEFRLGGNRLGQIILQLVGRGGFGLVPVGKLVIAALRTDFAGLRRLVIEGLN